MLLASTYDLVSVLVLVVFGAMLLAGPVICGLKGKYGMVAGGLLFNLLWYVGAIRLAKPDSWWARRFYGPKTLRLAQDRF